MEGNKIEGLNMRYKRQIKFALVLSALFSSACNNNHQDDVFTVVNQSNNFIIHSTLREDSSLLLEQRINTLGVVKFEQFKINDSMRSVRWYDNDGIIEKSIDYRGNDSSYIEKGYESGVIKYIYQIKDGLEYGEWVSYKKGNVFSKIYFTASPSNNLKVTYAPSFIQFFDRPTLVNNFYKRELFWLGYDLVHWREKYNRDGNLISRQEVVNKEMFDSIKSYEYKQDIQGKVLSPKDSI